MSRRLRRQTFIGVAVGALAIGVVGCSILTSTFQPDKRRGEVLVGEPRIGVEYQVDLGTHCGLTQVKFAGGFWDIQGSLDDGNGNPPPGFGNPMDAGTITLISGEEAIYRNQAGEQRKLTKAAELPPTGQLCA
jgi:hypothetical protein